MGKVPDSTTAWKKISLVSAKSGMPVALEEKRRGGTHGRGGGVARGGCGVEESGVLIKGRWPWISIGVP